MCEVVKLKPKLSFDLVLGVGRILKTLSRQSQKYIYTRLENNLKSYSILSSYDISQN